MNFTPEQLDKLKKALDLELPERGPHWCTADIGNYDDCYWAGSNDGEAYKANEIKTLLTEMGIL